MARKNNIDTDLQLNPLSWMLTFSDLITLLVTFFVLFLSMSSMDVKAVRKAFGLFTGGSGPLSFSERGGLEDISRVLDRFDQVPSKMLLDQTEFKELIFQSKDLEYQKLLDLAGRDISVDLTPKGLVLRVADFILFKRGSAKINKEYLPVLNRIAVLLRGSRRSISVEGHTDPAKLGGEAKSAAWKLSLDRAMAVARYFIEKEGLIKERFRVGGFGPSRPLYPSGTLRNRAKNRRIEIILYKEQLG